MTAIPKLVSLFSTVIVAFTVDVIATRNDSNVKFCSNPPVLRSVDLSAYSGIWYSIFNSGNAVRVTGGDCTTANYTLQPDNTVAVLNCQRISKLTLPSCVRGRASRQPEFNRSSRLQVQFGPFPAGPYEIISLLGTKSYGYKAAAVFSCEALPSPAPQVPSFFIISRSPYAPRFVLKRLIKRVRRKGFRIKSSDFVESFHPPSCRYIQGPGSFVLASPGGSSPQGSSGPPPGVFAPPGVPPPTGPPPDVLSPSGPPL